MNEEYVIDFNSQPEIPEGYEIRPRDQIVGRLKGKCVINPKNLRLYLAEGQGIFRNSEFIYGPELKKDLKGKRVVGAQLLDFYLKNQHLIPEEYKNHMTDFWGTLYRHIESSQLMKKPAICFRSLIWFPEQKIWQDQFIMIYSVFDNKSPALIAE